MHNAAKTCTVLSLLTAFYCKLAPNIQKSPKNLHSFNLNYYIVCSIFNINTLTAKGSDGMYFDLDSPIRVTGFGRITQGKGFWHDDWLSCNYMLMYIAGGSVAFKSGEKEYTLNEGDTLIVSPKTVYRPLESRGCVYYYFYFGATNTEPYESSYKIRTSHSVSVSNFAYSFEYSNRLVIEVQEITKHVGESRLDKIFNRCAELDMWQRPFEKMLLDNYLKEVLIQLNLMQKSALPVEKVFIRMTNFIERNYRSKIGLGEVAQKVHISPSYAAKLFKKNVGMRCSDYINKVRLAAACEFLVNSHMRISEIAYAVGYQSPYYFARQFKTVYGMSASEFRKNR